MKPQAILTFDLEFWYNSNFLKSTPQKNINDFSIESTERVLSILADQEQIATFFVLGSLAEKYPDLIKKISKQKHEIASHGYSHKTLSSVSRKEFAREIKLSKEILERTTDLDIKGFRAPNFSLNKKTVWIFDVLKSYGFVYDSSQHPLKKLMPQKNSPVKEVPCGLGGIYFRILPLWLFLFLAKLLKKTRLPIFYFHPHEFFCETPRLEGGHWWKRKIKYWGIKTAWLKFKKLNNKYQFISIEQFIYENTTN